MFTHFSRRFFMVSSLAALFACSADGPEGTAPRPVLDAGTNDNGNGVLVEVGEHSVPFGLVTIDPDAQLLMYYRWNDGFCGGIQGTEFVQSSFHDIVRLNETWQTLDKVEGLWVYVYHWNGAAVTCNFLSTTPALATGRADRLIHDNDFYPFAPYGPGPGANAYLESYHGSLTNAAGGPVQFSGQTNIVVAPDGVTLRVVDTDLHLSPDPRN